MVMAGVRKFMYDMDRPAMLIGDLVGLCVDGNWYIWVQSCGCHMVYIYRIYAKIPRIFFLEFSEEKLGCAHYLKQGWYYSASKQKDPVTR